MRAAGAERAPSSCRLRSHGSPFLSAEGASEEWPDARLGVDSAPHLQCDKRTDDSIFADQRLLRDRLVNPRAGTDSAVNEAAIRSYHRAPADRRRPLQVNTRVKDDLFCEIHRSVEVGVVGI